jgi:hypothetical protein
MGTVQVAGRRRRGSQFHWIRPRIWIGSKAAESVTERCPKCDVPTRMSVDPDVPNVFDLVKCFGTTARNFARIGQFQWPVTRHAYHFLAVSGGLFTVLWNHRIKGMLWHPRGQIPLISLRPDEPTFEATRRFSDAFAGKSDLFLRHKRRTP